MAHRKAGGTAKNLRDSNPKYLGVKKYSGEKAWPGAILLRQRGSRMEAGKNVSMGKDHTLFATKEGVVSITSRRKTSFNGKTQVKKVINVT